MRDNDRRTNWADKRFKWTHRSLWQCLIPLQHCSASSQEPWRQFDLLWIPEGINRTWGGRDTQQELEDRDQKTRGAEDRTETPTLCFGCRSLAPWHSRLRSSCRSWSDHLDSVCPWNSLHLTRTGTKEWLIPHQISFNRSFQSGRSLTCVFGELLGGPTGLVHVNIYIQSPSPLTWSTSYRNTKPLNSGYLQLLKCCV